MYICGCINSVTCISTLSQRKKAPSSEAAEPEQSPAPDTLTAKHLKKDVNKVAETPPSDRTSKSHQETEIRGSSSDENSSLTQGRIDVHYVVRGATFPEIPYNLFEIFNEISKFSLKPEV